MTGSVSGPTGTRPLVAPELLPMLEMFPAFELNEATLPLIRSAASSKIARPSLSPEQRTVLQEERFIPGPCGAPDVHVLIYTSPARTAEPRPAYLHIHGGGYVLGSADMWDLPNRSLALALNCVVVSVDYRLAPETRFPGALEDCYAALHWLHANAAALGVDSKRIAIGGESAGAGHAAALALLARKRGEVPIRLQLLDSPMLDDRTGSAANPHPYCGEFVWPPEKNRFGWRALLGVEPGGPDVPSEAAPARAADLSGLPPTFIVVGALDLFFEESLEYARRLMRSGVPTELHVVPGAFHGFSGANAASPQAQASVRWRHDALGRAFVHTTGVPTQG